MEYFLIDYYYDCLQLKKQNDVNKHFQIDKFAINFGIRLGLGLDLGRKISVASSFSYPTSLNIITVIKVFKENENTSWNHSK